MVPVASSSLPRQRRLDASPTIRMPQESLSSLDPGSSRLSFRGALSPAERRLMIEQVKEKRRSERLSQPRGPTRLSVRLEHFLITHAAGCPSFVASATV